MKFYILPFPLFHYFSQCFYLRIYDSPCAGRLERWLVMVGTMLIWSRVQSAGWVRKGPGDSVRPEWCACPSSGRSRGLQCHQGQAGGQPEEHPGEGRDLLCLPPLPFSWWQSGHRPVSSVAAGGWDPNPRWICFPGAQSRVLARWDAEPPVACDTLSLPASGLERDSSLGQWGPPLRSTGLEAGFTVRPEQGKQDLGGMNGSSGGSDLGLHRLLYLKSYQTCDNRFLLYLNFLWEYIAWEMVFLIIYFLKNPTNSLTFKEINDTLWARGPQTF